MPEGRQAEEERYMVYYLYLLYFNRCFNVLGWLLNLPPLRSRWRITGVILLLSEAESKG